MKRGNRNGGDEEGYELCYVCDAGNLNDVKKLVTEGVSLNREYKTYGWNGEHSPLWYACRCDHVEVVRFLLDSEADPNYGKTHPLLPVCYWSSPNSLAIARLLLDRGADVNAKGAFDVTPLIFSCSYTKQPIELLELLIEKGAQINAVDEGGDNALSYAVVSSHAEAAFFLLENESQVAGREQSLMKMIIEKNQSDAPRMIRLLRIAWERGVRDIYHRSVRDMIILSSWSPTTHWIYSITFKNRIKTFLLVWNRLRIEYYGLPRQLIIPIIQYMALHETKTVYSDTL